jgi:transketolase
VKEALVSSLDRLLHTQQDLVFLTADLGYMAFEELIAKYPTRVINVGVAESNMIGLAAGLSRAGKRVICYSMIPFITLRCLEQIKVHLSIGKLPIVLIGVGAGYTYGNQGSSHHSIEDLGVMRSMSSIDVFHPSHPNELIHCLEACASSNRPSYLRLGWTNAPYEWRKDSVDIERPNLVFGNGKRIVFSTGSLVSETIRACENLSAQLTLYSVAKITPLDETWFVESIRQSVSVAVIEPNRAEGSLGERLAYLMICNNISIPFWHRHLPPDYFRTAGSKTQLEDYAGVSTDQLRKFLTAMCNG